MSEPTFVSKINLHNVYRIHEESHNQRLNFFSLDIFAKSVTFFLTRVYFFHYMK